MQWYIYSAFIVKEFLVILVITNQFNSSQVL